MIVEAGSINLLGLRGFEKRCSCAELFFMSFEGEGNARVEGSWRLDPAGTGTKVQLHTKGTLEVDFPGFLQFLLSPLIELAFVQKIDRYIENLQEAFASEE